ncbi:hypothetical protein KKG52_02090 [Patescibacteria group bacterium]|nr:hypothetical protein [Patescibacteria group bacterium]
MSSLSGKKLLLLGFIVVMLLAIPVTIYLVQKQQETRTRAEAATVISLTPAATSSTVGAEITLDISADPGTNQLNWIRLVINYDETKVSTAAAGLEPNAALFPRITGPTYEPGKITVELATGMSPENIIQTKTTIATLHLTALQPTDGVVTNVTFGRGVEETEARSVAETDLPGGTEDVLQSAIPAAITIEGVVETTTTTIPEVTTTTSTTTTSTTTTTTTIPEVINELPVCTDFSSDISNGSAPLTVTFSAEGTDSDGSITKVTFNFGDSSVQDITQTTGIGTGTVSAQIAHTYNNGGTFTSTAVITDDASEQSDPSTCSLTIDVEGTPEVTNTPTPTIAAPGPGDVFIAAGTIGAILSIIGLFLLFAI